ncbi:hypothetical protein WJX77_011414 [Trebouxia sp. C0004]
MIHNQFMLTVCEKVGGVRSTDSPENVCSSAVTWSPTPCQTPLAIAQEESAQLRTTLNDIEKLITAPRLTADGRLQELTAHLAVYHSQVYMRSDWTLVSFVT